MGSAYASSACELEKLHAKSASPVAEIDREVGRGMWWFDDDDVKNMFLLP